MPTTPPQETEFSPGHNLEIQAHPEAAELTGAHPGAKFRISKDPLSLLSASFYVSEPVSLFIVIFALDLSFLPFSQHPVSLSLGP